MYFPLNPLEQSVPRTGYPTPYQLMGKIENTDDGFILELE